MLVSVRTMTDCMRGATSNSRRWKPFGSSSASPRYEPLVARASVMDERFRLGQPSFPMGQVAFVAAVALSLLRRLPDRLTQQERGPIGFLPVA
jgi:hypothetical protein